MTEGKTRIKIIGCRNPHWWYVDRIGREYEAVKGEGEYRVVDLSEEAFGWVDENDCVVVTEGEVDD